MNRNSGVPGLAGLGLVSIALILAGCSAIDSVAHGRAQTDYTNSAAFAKEHADAAPWLPTDATSLTLVSSTREEGVMTLAYTSATAPEGCENAPRRSSPTMSVDTDVDTDVDIYAIDSVLVCGDWAVAGEGDRWVAWTPATESQ